MGEGECDPAGALDLARRLSSDRYAATQNLNAAKAALEVLVRSCILPHLSSGVGIPLRNRLKNNSSLAAASAAASECVSRECGEFDALYEAARLLGELAMDFSPEGASLQELVHSHHLPDLWAACFQLSYRPHETLEGGADNASNAKKKQTVLEMIDSFVEKLPVAHNVESMMVLLHTENPPAWLKTKSGKLLSRLLMREGGVAAVMERLVGSASQGDVVVHKRVAAHLAKCPQCVATPEEYYGRICPQLMKLLSLTTDSSKQFGESAARIISNMHSTSITTVCCITRQQPEAVENYVLEPLIKPLRAWASLKEKPSLTIVPVESLVKLGVLVTAGEDVLKEMIICKTKEVAPRLLLLHQFLLSGESNKHVEEIDEKLRTAVRDLVLVHLTQAVDRSLLVCCDYILRESLLWCRGRPGVYLSQQLLSTENWELIIALLDRIFRRVLSSRKNLDRLEDHEEILRLMTILEDILEPAGSKAFEEDTRAAAAFVKELLSCEEIREDEDLLQLGLTMLNRLITGRSTLPNSEDWCSIEELLGEICNNPMHTETSRHMANTLQNTISEKRK